MKVALAGHVPNFFGMAHRFQALPIFQPYGPYAVHGSHVCGGNQPGAPVADPNLFHERSRRARIAPGGSAQANIELD
jgi:hypothetical protein